MSRYVSADEDAGPRQEHEEHLSHQNAANSYLCCCSSFISPSRHTCALLSSFCCPNCESCKFSVPLRPQEPKYESHGHDQSELTPLFDNLIALIRTHRWTKAKWRVVTDELPLLLSKFFSFVIRKRLNLISGASIFALLLLIRSGSRQRFAALDTAVVRSSKQPSEAIIKFGAEQSASSVPTPLRGLAVSLLSLLPRSFAAESSNSLPMSEATRLIKAGNVERVEFAPNSDIVRMILRNGGGICISHCVPGSERTFFDLVSRHVPEYVVSQSVGVNVLQLVATLAVLVGYWKVFRIFRDLVDGQNNLWGPNDFQFHSDLSDGRNNDSPYSSIAFADVVSPAKERLMDVVSFLNDPATYARYGARLPRGVLLVGPSGTGKTLLARAVAGEAKVPFCAVSGSQFVEMYVGRGAKRIRQLFENARKIAPCVIFIDEIDALGSRGSSYQFDDSQQSENFLEALEGTGREEYVQTVNQLLTELDGFHTDKSGVVLLAATNRMSAVDSALLRPGRFDRFVFMELPTSEEREAILSRLIQRKGIQTDASCMDESDGLRTIANRTEGLTGADLECLVNEAILKALRAERQTVSRSDFEATATEVLNRSARQRRVGSHLRIPPYFSS